MIIDDHTRYMWTMLLKEKSEALENSRSSEHRRNKKQVSPSKLFELTGGESSRHQSSMRVVKKMGSRDTLLCHIPPQQNGVVERRNRTILEMTRSILKHMKVPNYMWGEGVRHATYLINRSATRTLLAMTPYEAFKGNRPNLSHLCVFGCVGYARVESPHRKKLDDRSRALVHLGTEPGTKAYRWLIQ